MTAAVPPPELRSRATGTADERAFITAGARTANDVRLLLRRCGAALGEPGQRVLDFGCGCGRVLRHFRPEREAGTEFHGVDLDAGAIAWCSGNLAGLGTFRVGPAQPPLPFADGWFDVAYGISVFTHLADAAHEAWLDELRRVVRPGGVALLTGYGPAAARRSWLVERHAEAVLLR
ncbi:MAG TPA: class I SAM-dependent methyltransferase [Micromonosporaceae bacterium]